MYIENAKAYRRVLKLPPPKKNLDFSHLFRKFWGLFGKCSGGFGGRFGRYFGAFLGGIREKIGGKKNQKTY